MSPISFSTAVRIARPVGAVFAYVADPRAFSDWNSAVESVDVAPGAGMRYVMQRQLPGGRVTNEVQITEHTPPTVFAMRSTSGPTPFAYRYRFEPAGRGTLMTLNAEVELAGLPSLARPLATHAVRRGVDANFATLRAILEHTPAA